MIFSSSATVYGVPERVPIDETMPLSATNPYGQTKLMIEEFFSRIDAQRRPEDQKISAEARARRLRERAVERARRACVHAPRAAFAWGNELARAPSSSV